MLFGFVSGAVVSDNVLEEFEEGAELVEVIVEKGSYRENNLVKTSSVGVEKIVERGNRYTALVSEDELEAAYELTHELDILRNGTMLTTKKYL